MDTLRKGYRLSAFIVCCLALASLTPRLAALDTYFGVVQYTNPAEPIYATGDPEADNPSGGPGTAVYPGYSLDMPYVSGWGTCSFRLFADTSVAKGMYYVGYFSGGNCYLSVY